MKITISAVIVVSELNVVSIIPVGMLEIMEVDHVKK